MIKEAKWIETIENLINIITEGLTMTVTSKGSQVVDLFLGLCSSKTARISSISREGTSTMVQDQVSTWLLSQLEEIADLRLV